MHPPGRRYSYLTAGVLTATLDTIATPTHPILDLQHTGYLAGLDPATAAWLRHITLTATSQTATR